MTKVLGALSAAFAIAARNEIFTMLVIIAWCIAGVVSLMKGVEGHGYDPRVDERPSVGNH